MFRECLVCGEHDERPTCPKCFSRLRRMIGELPEEFVLLTMSYQPVSKGGDGRSSAAVHAPLPCREDVLSILGPASRQAVTDGQDQVGPTPFLEVLRTWVEAVEDERRLTPVRRNVTGLVDRLLTHLRWIAEQPWVADFQREIEELVKVSRRITGTETRMELLRGVCCPSCGQFTMVRYVPDDYAARCRFCTSVCLDSYDWDLLVKAQVTQQTADDGVNT
jgi:hypothetical protein